MMRLALLLPLLVAYSCGSSSPPVNGDRSPAPAAADPAPKHALPAGSWIGLEVEVASEQGEYPLALRAWFYEALAQSPHFDFARNGTGTVRILLRGSSAPGPDGRLRLVTSLWRDTGDLVPLAGVDFERSFVVRALDELALETRRAIGEPEESLLRESRSCGLFVSAIERCAALCDRALLELQEGHGRRAEVELVRALRADDRSPLALSLLAALHADHGRTRDAAELAGRVTRLADRASPTSFSRAIRVRFMQEQRFTELLELANAAIAARPYDKDLHFSRDFSLCMLGRYAEAEASLEHLRTRYPSRPGPLFCLAHARLALGRADELLEERSDIEQILPEMTSFRLLAWALLLTERHDELATHLRLTAERFARDPELAPDLVSELNGMQCAHAILRGDDAQATELLLAELDRLRADPRLLGRRAERLPDLLWCLVRLGRAEQSWRFLEELERNPSTRLVKPYLATANAIARTWLGKGPTDKELATVRAFGLISWSERLAAQRAIRLGQYAEAERWLDAAVGRADQLGAALERAELQRSLGRAELARPVLATLRRELYRPEMAEPRAFVLSRPEHAIIARAAQD